MWVHLEIATARPTRVHLDPEVVESICNFFPAIGLMDLMKRKNASRDLVACLPDGFRDLLSGGRPELEARNGGGHRIEVKVRRLREWPSRHASRSERRWLRSRTSLKGPEANDLGTIFILLRSPKRVCPLDSNTVLD